MADSGKKTGLGSWMAANKLLTAIIGVVLAAGITVGVLFGVGVFSNNTDQPEGPQTETIDENWLRAALAEDGERVIELNEDIKATDGFEVKGTKTLKGTGKISMTESSNFVLSVEEGANFTMEGISLNVKNVGSNAVVIRDGGSVIWNDGTVSYPKQYTFMVYGDLTINGGTFEYAGTSWIYLKSGRCANVNGGTFVKSGSVGIEVEKNSTLNISGESTWFERAGSNTINNNGTVVMTGGTISQSEVWTITNHGSLSIKNSTIKDCSLKGAIYNYAEATLCEVEDSLFTNCKTYQIYNCAEVTAKNTIFEKSNASTINNNKGVINLIDCQILNSNYHSIYNLQGEINITNLVCDGTVYKAVQNKFGYVTIDGLTCSNIGGTAIGNVAVTTGGDYGWIKGKNVVINDAHDYGIVSYGGEVEFENVTVKGTLGTPVYCRAGKGTFINLDVTGSVTEGKACVCGGSTNYRNIELIIGGEKTHLTGGSRGISNYGKLTLNDGIIENNHSSGEQINGAGVYNVGEFIMNGGIIRNNEALQYGGGVRNGTSTTDDGVKHGGVMYMYGGEISNNYSASNGGGISIAADICELHMYGGTISGNRSNGKGDGLMVAGPFELYDGIIKDNDVYLYENQNTLTVKGTSLNKDNEIHVTTTQWNGAKANQAVTFDSSAARSALSKLFVCDNDQWSFTAKDKYLCAVMVDKDITYSDNIFKGASEVTVSDFAALKEEIEKTERGSAKIIKIAGNIKLEGNITLPYATSIKLIDNGSAKTLTRDAAFKGVLFSIGKSSTLVLAGKSGLTIDGNAGKVTAEDPLVKTVYGGTFVLAEGGRLANAFNGAYATSDRAGAVNIYSGQLIVCGGTIDNCGALAKDSAGKDTNLAAIYVATSGVMSIQSGTLKNCEYGVARSYGRVYMSGGTICDNKRIGDGGTGIRACNMVMTGGTFKNNFSSNSGCGVYITNSEAYPTSYFRMEGGVFTENISSRVTDKGASAGAVYFSADTVAYLNAGTISNNIAGSGDGEEAIVDGVLMGKHCGQSGAGVYNEGICYINSGMTITGNKAYNSGGGIYTNNKLYIDGANISDNETIGVYQGYGGGGAIMCTGEGYTEIKNATINNNKSGSSGTIYIDGRAEVKMVNTTMKGNEATGKSFAGYNSGSAILNKCKLTIENCTFEENKAGSKAAIYTDAGSKTYITGSKFIKNGAAGAAAIANTSAYTEIKDTLFDGNFCQAESTYSNGGAVMNQRKDASYANGIMIIENCEFKNNVAYQRTQIGAGGGYGAAIYNDYGELTVRNSKFSGNIAGNSGKDILNSSNAGSLTLGGTIDAEEFYFNVTKTVTLEDDFALVNPVPTIFNTYVSESQVLTGKDTVVAANVSRFLLKTTSGYTDTDTGKTSYTVIDKNGYMISTKGILNGYAAQVMDTPYWSFAEALAAAEGGETITLLRDINEDLTVPFGQTVVLAGPFTLNGNITVAGTLNLIDAKLSGGVTVSGELGVAGGAQVTGTYVDLGTTGTIKVNGKLTKNEVASVAGDITVGRTVITGKVDANSAARFVIAADITKQVNESGKIEVITDTVKVVESGNVYDTLTEAIAAANENDTIEILKTTGAGGAVVDKNLSITSASEENKINGVVTVAGGKVLTLKNKIKIDTVALAGSDAKLGLDETVLGGCATIDTSALGSLEDLKNLGIVILAGDIAGGYGKVDLLDNNGQYSINEYGCIDIYYEAMIGDTAYATFDEAFRAAADGDTIVLVHDVELTTYYKVEKNLTITTDGVARTITWPGKSGASTSYAFNSTAGTLTLCGTGEEGRLVIDGLGISTNRPMVCFQTANSSMKYVTIQNSVSADGGYGGAFYTNKTGIVLDHVIFKDNSSTASSGNNGGAIRISATGAVTANYCQFINNYSGTYGGAVTVNASNGKLTANNCLFDGNSSALVGGALYGTQSSGVGSVIICNNCTFTNNSTTGNGGAIRTTGNVTVNGCTFTGNTGTGDVSVSVPAVTFTRSVTDSNFTDKYYEEAFSDGVDSITITNNTYKPIVRSEITVPVLKAASADFDDKSYEAADLLDKFDADKMTAEVTLGGEKAEILLPGTYTITVTAGDKYIFPGEKEIATFTYTVNAVNVVLADPVLKTGCDSFSFDDLEHAISTLVDNYDANKMEAVVTKDSAPTVVKAVGQYVITITANEYYEFQGGKTSVVLNVEVFPAGESVAKIGNTEYATITGAINAASAGTEITLIKDIDSAVISKNVVFKGDKTITNATISNAALPLDLSNVTLTNVTFESDVEANTVVFAAGYESKIGTVTNENMVLVKDADNKALYTISTYSVTNGFKRYEGLAKAVEAAEEGDTLELHESIELDTTLILTKALTIKVADEVKEDVVITTKTQASGNYMINIKATTVLLGREDARIVLDGQGVSYSRPVLCIQAANDTKLTYVTVKNSKTSYQGGGIYFTTSTGVILDHCSVIDCESTMSASYGGGAFYLTGSAEITIKNSLISGNKSALYGGVAHVATKGKLMLDSCMVSNNSAADVGGALYGAQSSPNYSYIEAKNTVFKDNVSKKTGGAIRGNGSFVLDGCTFIGNIGTDADISEGNGNNYTRSINNCIFDKAEVAAVHKDSSTKITPDALSTTNIFSGKVILNGISQTSLAAAIAAASDGDEIFVLEDNVENVTIDKKLTINGYDEFALNGTVTISGSGQINADHLSAVFAIAFDSVSDGGKVIVGDKSEELAKAFNDSTPLTGWLYVDETGEDVCARYFAEKMSMLNDTQDIFYADFATAFAAAKDNDKLIVINDLTIDSKQVINKPITLTTDGKGDKTVTGYTTDFLFDIKAVVSFGGESESSKLVIDGEGKDHSKSAIATQAGSAGSSIRYLVIKNVVNTNTGTTQGSAYNNQSGITYTNCLFENNKTTYADKGNGGGFYGTATSNTTFVKCEFRGNIAARHGGAFYSAKNSKASFTSCLFETNSCASGKKGGVTYVNDGSTQYTFTDCTFKGNISGATTNNSIFSSGTDFLTLNNCTFIGQTEKFAIEGNYTSQGTNSFAQE